MKNRLLFLLITVSIFSPLHADRAIQIREVNFLTSTLELYNSGSTSLALDGWRFCSHDENQDRRYSTTTGLNGLSIAAGASLRVHFLNDAPEGDSSAINISGRGNFALDLDRGPYAIQLYNGGSFGNGNNIIDHVQWSIAGVDNASADNRSDEAQSGGVWTNQSLWVATTATSERIVFSDISGSILHSPDSYTVIEPLSFPQTLTIDSISTPSAGTVSLTWQDLSEFGTINYTIETSRTLEPDDWEPVFAEPLQTTSATISGLSDGPQFFRIVAELAS